MVLLLAAGAASAEGFVVRDLTELEPAARAALGPGYLSRSQPNRLTLTCPGCPGGPAVDILLGRQSDGTEGRVRFGQTSIAQLEFQCQARNPTCRMEQVGTPPAVGWISSYAIGDAAANTVVVLRDGDLLTIRVIAKDPAVARRDADAMIVHIVPRVVGR